MKHTFKAILSLLLVLALLLPVVLSCTKEPAEGTETQTSGTASGTEEPVTPVSDEALAKMSARVEKWFMDAVDNDHYLFSFTLDGQPMENAMTGAEKFFGKAVDEAGNTLCTLRYKLPTGLVIDVEATLFRNFPTVDFVVKLRNEGGKKSGMISDLYAVDSVFPLPRDSAYIIDTTRGALQSTTMDDYDFTLETMGMASGAEYTFSPTAGRSSNEAFPFFDILGKDCGLMVAIGWTGQWEAAFSLHDEGVRLKARQQKFNSYLKAGEEVRTPSVSITYFDGDAVFGHNLFRQLILEDYTPKKSDGTIVDIPLPYSVAGATISIKKPAGTISTAQIGSDTAWLDAGWYGYLEYSDSGENGGWADQVGNWVVNKNMHPSGSLAGISDYLHSLGQKFMLWFECERAFKDSDMIKNHKELFYPQTNTSSYLLALSQDNALEWLTEYISGCIADWGIDVYRQDFNINPLWIWEANDESKRAGMNENKYITNMYYFLDTLRARYPDLVIDNCASGGRRIDIEMLKRCLIMWRTDYSCHDGFTVEGYQYHTQNLNYWLPLHAAGMRADMLDTYVAVSGLGMENLFPAAANNIAKCKATLKMYKNFAPYLTGDYYQLLPPTFDETSFQMYELYRPDLDSAAVVVMNRKKNDQKTVNIVLKGLDPDQTYNLRDQSGSAAVNKTMTGKEWMEGGYKFAIKPGNAQFLILKPVESN